MSIRNLRLSLTEGVDCVTMAEHGDAGGEGIVDDEEEKYNYYECEYSFCSFSCANHAGKLSSQNDERKL